jgi:hypothetical protein
MSETGPHATSRDAPRLPPQDTSAEVLPVALQFNIQVAAESNSPTTYQDAVEIAGRFTPRTESGTTFRTAPGTVPGTVPTVVPGR